MDKSARSLKRAAPGPPPEEAPAKKIHPFFTKAANKPTQLSANFKWEKPLGKNGTCLHGVNLEPKCYAKIAAFDLDGTIIKSQFPSVNTPKWEWWRSIVPTRLKEVAENGYLVVVFSNQHLKPGPLKLWKEKILSIAATLDDIPFHLFAATARDGYRKPMPGMWLELEKLFKEQEVEIDLQSSLFVGDAAGRNYPNKKSDFSSTDRKMALNIGIPFMTPEEYFLNLPAHSNFSLPGFHVTSLRDLPLATPTSLPILPRVGGQEIVIFCGYPALGKTRFYRQHFQLANYVHINQDILKTRDKCVKAARDALKRGESCVIDNTNRDIKTRKWYVDIAQELTLPARCFIFTGSLELAWHNNLYRAFSLSLFTVAREPPRELIPYSAFTGFRDQYEEPTADEGFSEIRKVNWKFEGTEDERRHWSMWLQIDGT